MAVISEDRTILQDVFTVWTVMEAFCLFLVAFFYLKVYLGIRNRKVNEIAQIDVLMKAKLESKVAETTGLLTAAIISWLISIIAFAILANLVPFFGTNASIRFMQLATQLNSLFNPLLYFYREHRFRNAVRELLGIKKPQEMQSIVGAAQFIKRNDPFRSSELHKVGKRTQRLTRSASCNLTEAIHGTPSVVLLKKCFSAPTLETCNSF